MPTTVQTPDGGQAVFPDGMGDAQIEAVLQREYPQTAPASPGASAGAAFHPSAPPPSTLQDVAQSAWGGLLTGAAGLKDMTDPAQVMMGAAKAAAGLVNPKAAAFLAKITPQSSAASVAPVGGSYQPRTTPGRYAHAVAAMAPNAVFPESIPAKIAATVAPAVVGQGASDLTQAAGGDQTAQGVAQIAGNLFGGGLAGLKGLATKAPQVLSDAERPVADAIQSALDMTGAHRDDVKVALSTGVHPAAATPGLTQLADNVHTLPGLGQVLIGDSVGQRFATQSDRALQAVQDHLGVEPAAARGDVDSIVKQGQAAVGPQYDSLRANPAPVMTPRLALLAQTPAVKKAIGVAVSDMQNNVDGPSPTAAGFKLDPDTGAWQMPTYGIGSVAEQQPTAATWIKVHQALGQTVDRNPITNAPIPDNVSPGNHNITVAGGHLGDELRTAIPGYGDVLDQSGDYLSTRSAFNRASGMLFSKPVYDFQQMWSSLKNPSEVKAAQSALANDILTKTEGQSVAPGLFKPPGVQQKMAIAFPGKSGAFLQQMEDDLSERQALGGVISGPPSAKRLLADKYAATQAKPVGPIRRFAQNTLGSVDNIASYTHLPTAITRTLKLVAGTNTPKVLSPPPWENPQTNATLGALLSDPAKMAPFLDRMAAQKAIDYKSARSGGLLNGPRLALPGLLSGLVAPGASAATPGQPNQ